MKSNAKIFALYNWKQHGLEQTFIPLKEMVSRQKRAKLMI